MTPLPRTTAMLTLIALVFQFGACPCGCPHHNRWLELVGLHDSDHDAHSESKQGSDPNSRHGSKGAAHFWGLTPFSYMTPFSYNETGVSADHHRCDGNGKPQYLHNVRQLTLAGSTAVDQHFVASGIPTRSGQASLGYEGRAGPPSGNIADRSLVRSALQIYRL